MIIPEAGIDCVSGDVGTAEENSRQRLALGAISLEKQGLFRYTYLWLLQLRANFFLWVVHR